VLKLYIPGLAFSLGKVKFLLPWEKLGKKVEKSPVKWQKMGRYHLKENLPDVLRNVSLNRYHKLIMK
jgi:hypothetical protein